LGRRPGQLLSAGLIAAGAAAGAWALVEPARLKVRRLDVPLERWPPALDGLKVAVISDLHTGAPHVDARKVDRIVAKVNAALPDLVALVGDYADPTVPFGEPVAPERVAESLGGLRAPLGVFAVLGNHDWVHYGERVPRALRKVGIEVLENDAVAVERGGAVLWVAGIADLRERRPDVTTALAMVPPGQALIALTHDPDMFPQLRGRAAVTLAGHTHGGQIGLPLVRRATAPTRHGYTGGEVREEGGYMYVSRGVGTTGLAVRLAAPPEIAVLTLRASWPGGPGDP
jgi:predicted MPP superfamily phosphohydrolase